MSKLRERIRATLQRRSVPLGFGARDRAAETQRHVLVLAEVGAADAAAQAVAAGADALLAGGAEGIEAIVEAAGDRPVGARVAAATSADADALIAAGADFLVFDDAQTEAAALLGPDLGYVALLPGGAAEEDLRLLQPLDLDAILIPQAGAAATVRDQLLTRRIADLTRKPLIVPIEASADATQLEVWRDAGALVALVSGADGAAIEGLVAAAAAVPAPRERREDRPNALVPSQGSSLFDEDDESPF